MANKTVYTGNLSSKDYGVDAGILRVKTGVYHILSNGGGAAVFDSNNVLGGWVQPLAAKENAVSVVDFINGIGYYTYDNNIWVLNFFKKKRSFSYKTGNYNLTEEDGTLECNGTFQITLPTLSSITHYDYFTIINNGVGIITIQTSNNQLLGDTQTFLLYPQESLSFQKGNITYIVK